MSRSHYEPFGKRLGGDKAGIGFTGYLQNEDLNLTYMQARYYDPLIGRFYTNDPVDVLGHLSRGNSPSNGFNRYAYANNNPYKYVDPDGEFAFFIPLIGAAIGGYQALRWHLIWGLVTVRPILQSQLELSLVVSLGELLGLLQVLELK
ncbi:RHS repeat-associated core domain-containing protein [Shewanella fodinae]|uniref:RHS repeat-associated protein n=1 Tax=Shewanella fodinae TaxID=552357 RepID=A0A4R2F413_9GAMM|nr:RHS repeat-associated core domain-containing protein [Shewanella fodinae]TCN79453.1 RHS repeat-associated protein [Shewanella fodinae]